jgi:hypothetical protein
MFARPPPAKAPENVDSRQRPVLSSRRSPHFNVIGSGEMDMRHRVRKLIAALAFFLCAMPSAAQEGFTWGRPVAVTDIDQRLAEPMDMLIAPDGTIVIVLSGSKGAGQCILFSSADRGCTWRNLAVIPKMKPLATAVSGNSVLVIGCQVKQALLWKIGVADGKAETFTILSKEGLQALGKDCKPEFCRLSAHGNDMCVVMVTEKPAHVVFTKSADGGKTWTKPVFIAENLSKGNGMAPALFRTQDALNVASPRRTTTSLAGQRAPTTAQRGRARTSIPA